MEVYLAAIAILVSKSKENRNTTIFETKKIIKSNVGSEKGVTAGINSSSIE